MKKVLLFGVLSLGVGIISQANDTLTRAQVYNFNAGDTFEYLGVDMETFPTYYNHTGYYRKVITNKYVSSSNDTIIYEINNGYSEQYTDLDTIEIFSFSAYCPDSTYYFDSLAGTNITVNTVSFNCFEAGYEWRFARDLGKIYSYWGGMYDGQYPIEHSSLLTYFNKGGIIWGTPNFTSINEVNTYSSTISISPNPATTSVTINIDEKMLGSLPKGTATVTDITGRKIEAVQLQTPNSKLEIANFPNGIYFVTVANNRQSATRKLVIQK